MEGFIKASSYCNMFAVLFFWWSSDTAVWTLRVLQPSGLLLIWALCCCHNLQHVSVAISSAVLTCCCNIKHFFNFTSLFLKIERCYMPLLCSAVIATMWFIYLFIDWLCVWECVWQECHPSPWLSRQTVEYWTQNATMNLSRATNDCRTSARRVSMPPTQQQHQVG